MYDWGLLLIGAQAYSILWQFMAAFYSFVNNLGLQRLTFILWSVFVVGLSCLYSQGVVTNRLG